MHFAVAPVGSLAEAFSVGADFDVLAVLALALGAAAVAAAAGAAAAVAAAAGALLLEVDALAPPFATPP